MNETTAQDEAAAMAATRPQTDTVLALIFGISAAHLLNDTIQALLPSIYPILRNSYQLDYTQLGLITFTFQLTASLLQPLVGWITDRKPMPYSLPIGMGFTLIGLISLANSTSFPTILMSAAMIGTGSAVFHPGASRIAFMAAGKRRGLAQSIFQVGGNAGSAIGPLLAALVIVPHGQRSIIAFSAVALLGVVILSFIGRWQSQNVHRMKPKAKATGEHSAYPPKTVAIALAVLVALTFSKYVYLSSLTSYYTFYLIDRFHIPVQSSQYYLFLLLAAVAVGTIAGGPIGDRIGRKRVIWVSILGVAPFSLLLPHVGLGMTAALSVVIGLVLASAFSAILVYAQELLPGKVGMIAGLFFGLAFGIAGIGSAVLGKVADHQGINFVFQICAYLPLIGILTVFLPDVETEKE
ncbi:MFS transporter [Luteolibacter soli]|uniref:MFS transporter n=1 Tax=Luteolibacter soli TaxID=3135280 RepID=A0ABU9AYB6_9BACT